MSEKYINNTAVGSQLSYGMVAVLLVLGGCNIMDLDIDNGSRRVPALNPGAPEILSQRTAPAVHDEVQPLPPQLTSAPPAEQNAQPYAESHQAPAARTSIVSPRYADPAYRGKTEEKEGFFSRVTTSVTSGLSYAADEVKGWFADDEHEEQSEGFVRYTPPQNVAILRGEEQAAPLIPTTVNGASVITGKSTTDTAIQKPDNGYTNLSSVPAMPPHEGKSQITNTFDRLETERVQAEAVRQKMVTGDDMAAQMKSAKLSGFVEAQAANLAPQAQMQPQQGQTQPQALPQESPAQIISAAAAPRKVAAISSPPPRQPIHPTVPETHGDVGSDAKAIFAAENSPRAALPRTDKAHERHREMQLSHPTAPPAQAFAPPPPPRAAATTETQRVVSAPAASGQRPVRNRRMVNQEWGVDTPQEIYAPVSGNMPEQKDGQSSAASPAIPVKTSTMDAYTAEIIGERILPLEETQIQTSSPQTPPSPGTAAASTTNAAQQQQYQAMETPPAVAIAPPPPPVYTPAVAPQAQSQRQPQQYATTAAAAPYEAVPPLETAEVPQLEVQSLEEEGMRGYGAEGSRKPINPDADVAQAEYSSEYSYYEETAPRLRAPAPIARQTIFLPESRYARRRLGR